MPLLAIWLPKLSVPRVAPYLHSAAGLFQRELAPSTTLLCAINALSLLGIYVILQWMPAILHSSGVSPSRAILGTSMYGLGTNCKSATNHAMMDPFGVEPVLVSGLTLGACCVLAIGLFYPGFWRISLLAVGRGNSQRLPSGNHLALGTDISVRHSFARRGLGDGSRTSRNDCGTAL